MQRHEGQDLRSFRRRGVLEQHLHCRRWAVEDAKTRRLVRQPAAFVKGQVGADLVFLDHGQIGFGGGIEGAQQGLDEGKAAVPGFPHQRRQGGQTPCARDQPVMTFGQRHHLDRHLLAAVADAGLERGHLVRIHVHPVALKMRGLDR